MIQDLKAQGYGVLITDHNVRETLSITDRTYLIHDGAIFLSGTPEEVAGNELARKFYLGENFEWESHVRHTEEAEVKNEEPREDSEIENNEVPLSSDSSSDEELKQQDDEIEISTLVESEFESETESDVSVPEKTEKDNEENNDGLLVVKN